MPLPESETGPRRILSAISAASFAFLITAGALHGSILASIHDPLFLHADARSEKLVMLDRWHGKVFSAVFGSSHVHNGFDPRAFDHALSGSLVATRTANLAIEGGSQSEQRAMALQFVSKLEPPTPAGASPQPCLVMLEIGAGANFTNDHLVHPRAINIYDWRTTRLVEHFVTPAMDKRQRFGRIGYALAASALYYANIGMLSNAIFSPPIDQRILDYQTIEDRRGVDILPDYPPAVASIAREIATAPAPLRIQPAIVTPGASELVAQLAQASPVPNLSFVYLEMPKAGDVLGTYDFPDHLAVPSARGTLQVPIINLARPDRFPQIYEPTLWHDNAHLNGRGAALVSAVFAQQLKLWYAAHGLPQRCGG